MSRLGRWVAVAATLTGCARHGASSPGAPAALAPGTLPAGCAAVVRVEVAALRPLIEALGVAAGADATVIKTLADLAPGKQLERITYCRFEQGRPVAPRFVALAEGKFEGAILDRIASTSKREVRRETIQTVPVMLRDGLWLASRGGGEGRAEMVVANERELLQAGLFGQAGSYPLERRAAFAAVIGPAMLHARNIAGNDPASMAFKADFQRIQFVTVAVPPPVDTVTARFVVGDDATAGRLVNNLKPIMTEFSRRLGTGGVPGMPESAEVRDGDVHVRLALPPGTMDTIVSKLLARAPLGRKSPLGGP